MLRRVRLIRLSLPHACRPCPLHTRRRGRRLARRLERNRCVLDAWTRTCTSVGVRVRTCACAPQALSLGQLAASSTGPSRLEGGTPETASGLVVTRGFAADVRALDNRAPCCLRYTYRAAAAAPRLVVSQSIGLSARLPEPSCSCPVGLWMTRAFQSFLVSPINQPAGHR